MGEDRSGGLNLNKSANSYANIPLIIHYVLINWEVVTSKKRTNHRVSPKKMSGHMYFMELDRLLH